MIGFGVILAPGVEFDVLPKHKSMNRSVFHVDRIPSGDAVFLSSLSFLSLLLNS